MVRLPGKVLPMQTLKVAEMTCSHCERAVTAAVQTLDGRATVQVDLASGRVKRPQWTMWRPSWGCELSQRSMAACAASNAVGNESSP